MRHQRKTKGGGGGAWGNMAQRGQRQRGGGQLKNYNTLRPRKKTHLFHMAVHQLRNSIPPPPTPSPAWLILFSWHIVDIHVYVTHKVEKYEHSKHLLLII